MRKENAIVLQKKFRKHHKKSLPLPLLKKFGKGRFVVPFFVLRRTCACRFAERKTSFTT